MAISSLCALPALVATLAILSRAAPAAAVAMVWVAGAVAAAAAMLFLRGAWTAPVGRIAAWLRARAGGGAAELHTPLASGATKQLAEASAAAVAAFESSLAVIGDDARRNLRTGEYLVKASEQLSGTIDRLTDSAGIVRSGGKSLEAELDGAGTSAEELEQFVGRVSSLLGELSASYKEQTARLEPTLQAVLAASEEMGRRRAAASSVAEGAESLRGSLQTRARALLRLGEMAGRISTAVAGIADLSERTQMLAMNAAIQASRAGESGKGFNVIAREIRRFSEETTELVKNARVSFQELSADAAAASALVEEAAGSVSGITADVAALAAGLGTLAATMDQAASRSREVMVELGRISAQSEQAKSESHGASEKASSLRSVAAAVRKGHEENEKVVSSLLADVAQLSNAVESFSSLGRNQAASSKSLVERLESNAIRVGSRRRLQLVTNAWPPYIDERDGAPVGIDADLIRAAGAALGWDLRFEFLPWDACVDMARSGATDGVFSLNKSEERSAFLSFPAEHNSESASVFFSRAGAGVAASSFEDLAGLRIGVIEGYSYEGGLMEARGFERMPAGSDETNLKRLAAGAVDLVVADRLVGLHLCRKLGIREKVEYLPWELNRSLLYLAFSRAAGRPGVADELAAAYSGELSRMRADGRLAAIQAAYS